MKYPNHIKTIELPKCNEWGTPISKMPNCPVCNEDELGMIHPNYTICYSCGTEFHRFSFSNVGENLFVYKMLI